MFQNRDFAEMKSILIQDERSEKLARAQRRESDEVSRALHVGEVRGADRRGYTTKEGTGWRDRSTTPSNENKVFVRNLSWSVVDNDLRSMFTKTGTVVDAQVAKDRTTGKSRGYGFVTFSSPKEANQAVKVLNGRELRGREIMVKPALGKDAVSKVGKENLAKMAREEELEEGFALNVLERECEAESNECIVESDEEINFKYSCLMSLKDRNPLPQNVRNREVFIGIVDSGCSAHLTPSGAILNKREGGGRRFEVANGQYIKGKGVVGDVTGYTPASPTPFSIKKIEIVPEATNTLLSVWQFLNEGYDVWFDHRKMSVSVGHLDEMADNKVEAIGLGSRGTFRLSLD